MTQPSVRPEATLPGVSQPEATQPEVTLPGVSQPGVSQPEATQPEVTQPEVTQPVPTQPGATRPGATGPGARPRMRRFRPGGTSRADVLSIVGAVIASLSLVWILYTRLLPFSGLLGFAVCWYVMFLAIYAVIIVHEHGRLAVVDRLVSMLVHSAGAFMVSALVLILGYTVFRGVTAIKPNFFSQTMALTGPLDPLSQGGAVHAVLGSLLQLGAAVLISVPLGIATALFLVEVKGRLARPVRLIVDTMSALPSIVAGLFILATVILTLGFDKSGFAASLAISVMMVPIVTRAAEVVFRLVPGGLREAAYALGATQWGVVWRVVLPTARSGLATAVVLAMARGVGETAPVLLTAGFARDTNLNPFSGPMTSLPLYIYTYVKYPQPNMIARAYAAALTLAVVVLVLFFIARMLGGAAPGELTRRQQRRVTREAILAAGPFRAPAPFTTSTPFAAPAPTAAASPVPDVPSEEG